MLAIEVLLLIALDIERNRFLFGNPLVAALVKRKLRLCGSFAVGSGRVYDLLLTLVRER